jgi:hypothetical protein
MAKSGFTTGEVDSSTLYVSLDQAMSGIGNTTDGGVSTVVLKNFQTSSFLSRRVRFYHKELIPSAAMQNQSSPGGSRTWPVILTTSRG